MKKFKKMLTLENMLFLYIILCPILDIVSFLFRNYFDTSFSPTTFLRPIIPAILFIILFFKEENKKQKIGIICIYCIYSIVHLWLFQKLHNGSSYGTIENEIQYLANYSIMIINLYSFNKIIKNKEKLINTVFVSLLIYIVSLVFSIITKTSSPTYIEGIGYKGYFESGNSLCTVLLLAISIILSNIKLKDWKKILVIAITGIYLLMFSGMRTGLFGFSIIIGSFILGKLFINIRDNKKFNKNQIITITSAIILIVISIFILGSKTLERRKLLKMIESINIDEETQEKRFVTGDILELYKRIQKGEVDESYMSQEEQKSIIGLVETAEKIKLSNVNLRKQQLIYNFKLLKEQKNIAYLLFGNGFKNQTGELVMEMEVPAFLCNFGLIGFILYFGPFLGVLILGLFNAIKNIKIIQINDIMYTVGMGLAIMLSSLSGYVFFNFSSMTMVIVLAVLIRGERGWKIITILTALEFCLKMLTYRKYAPLFSQNSALSKFNSFPTGFVLKERNGSKNEKNNFWNN